MSDPVQSAEIEDVLSSIRRLVSEDPKPRPAAVAGPDMLVLTPAQRVEQPQNDSADVEADDQADAPELAVAEEAADVPEERAADEHTAEESPAEPAEDQLTVAPEEPAQEAEADAADMAEFADDSTDEAPVRSWGDVTLEDRIAELEAAVAKSGEDWEPDGSESMDDDVSVQAFPRASAEPETDTDEAQAMADTPEEERAAADPDPSLPDDEDDGLFLDEESLRAMINEIVREELQGSLGQRITRNVRKLVRQEINRALAARDFD